jgi:Uma2 family endonuclease
MNMVDAWRVMMTQATGPFRASQLRDGDRYELWNGHAIPHRPPSQERASAKAYAALVIASDPAVEDSAMDAGYALDGGKTLRAPDVSVAGGPRRPGFDPEAPPLAIEYADSGQDEVELRQKIIDLIRAGTRYVWVVRLTEPRQIEVHQPKRAMKVVPLDGVLTATGVLKNPVPARALVERDAAMETTLRNLLNRKGYASLDAVRSDGEAEGFARGVAAGKAEGKVEGKVEAIVAIANARGVSLSAIQVTRLSDIGSVEALDAILAAVARASTPNELAEVLTLSD